MLDPSECLVSHIGAANQMTLVLPRSRYEHRCLIVMCDGKPFAVCLDDVNQLGRFRAFQCDQNDAWNGLHIPGVRIELDETSLYDVDGYHVPLGSMVRSDDKLEIRVNMDGPRYATCAPLILLDGLPPSAPHISACFMKWQVVLGEGDDKRVLLQIDSTPQPATA